MELSVPLKLQLFALLVPIMMEPNVLLILLFAHLVQLGTELVVWHLEIVQMEPISMELNALQFLSSALLD